MLHSTAPQIDAADASLREALDYLEAHGLYAVAEDDAYVINGERFTADEIVYFASRLIPSGSARLQ